MVFDQIMTFLAVNRVSLYYNGRRAMSCLWHVNCTFFLGGGGPFVETLWNTVGETQTVWYWFSKPPNDMSGVLKSHQGFVDRISGSKALWGLPKF